MASAGIGAGNDGIQVVQGDIVIAHRSNDNDDLEPPQRQEGVERMAVPTKFHHRRQGEEEEERKVLVPPRMRGNTQQRKRQDTPAASNKVRGK